MTGYGRHRRRERACVRALWLQPRRVHAARPISSDRAFRPTPRSRAANDHARRNARDRQV
jgi:hypothetical protein